MIALPDHAMQMTSRSKLQIPQGCRPYHREENGGNGEAEVETVVQLPAPYYFPA